jgi:hypothetical protein
MKNTPIHVCDETAFVGWPSTKSRRMSCFRNLAYRPSIIISENALNQCIEKMRSW